MRVLFVSASGALGGAERVLLETIRGIRARGHDAFLVAGETGPLVERAGAWAETAVLPLPARVARTGESGRSWSSVALALPALAPSLVRFVQRLRATGRAWHPDIVHTNGIKPHLAAAMAGLPGAVVWHLHDYVGTRAVSSRLLRAFGPRCRRAIANSASVAADFEATVPGVPVTTVLNGVDIERFSDEGDRLDLDGLAGLDAAPPGTIRVGLVATFAWWKGHEVFLESVARLPRTLPVRGYVIGGPVYATRGSQLSRRDLDGMVERHGLAGRIGMTGFVDDTPAALRSLDIVVHASTEPEPFGLVIAEAMACGRPVIAAGAGGAVELVRDGCDALVHRPGDAGDLARQIERLATDAPLRARLGRAARRAAADRLSLPAYLAGVEQAYACAVRGGAACAS